MNFSALIFVRKLLSLLSVTTFPKTSQIKSIEGELTVAVRASRRGKPIFAKPMECSLTIASIASLIFSDFHSSIS